MGLRSEAWTDPISLYGEHLAALPQHQLPHLTNIRCFQQTQYFPHAEYIEQISVATVWEYM